MKSMNQPIKNILNHLQERAKELNCLYKIEELLANPDVALDEIFFGIINAIPQGWQYPEHCRVRLNYGDKQFESPDFKETSWTQTADIIVQQRKVGNIQVCYVKKVPFTDEGPFLKEERQLLNTIAQRTGHFIMYQCLKHVHRDWETITEKTLHDEKNKWRLLLDILKSTDTNLYQSISRKMLNYLCWNGIEEAEILLEQFGSHHRQYQDELPPDPNRPTQKEYLPDFLMISDDIFRIAANHLSINEILTCVQDWIRDDRSSFLVDVLESFNTSIADIYDAFERYYHGNPFGIDVTPATEKAIIVSLIYRLFTEQLQFINIAKNYVAIRDFYDLLQRIIFSQQSNGKLGGKSAGLFLASQIIKKFTNHSELLNTIKFPKTWYVTSDSVFKFIRYNNLEDLLNQKYKDIDQIRQEYPNIVQIFKHSYFPQEIKKGLSTALDDLTHYPLIVRSSSLLEDRMGASFSGKYKSLFLANQGSKKERLDALMDAIAEVYASIFSPDPIEYRSEKGLLDFHEEMGIMIQEVVGTKVGHYFLPAFAGVAFSNNEFRWSARIRREDGLIRLVPGLGTRAVDRLSDDYPILIAPGQPNLRVNVSINEIIRYSPVNIDVINLQTNSFETIKISDLFKKFGKAYPLINQVISIYDQDQVKKPSGVGIDFDNDQLVVTFAGLIDNTPFVNQVKTLLMLLQEKLELPVDIEFASDGQNFYLLQCRHQCYADDSKPMPIPKDIPGNKIIFSAKRFISNGKIPDITHIVYVDPANYKQLTSYAELTQVARVVSKLNKLLPKRKFILMGPGRWGSRGDIKLGVNVTYSDINNTAVLIEIARKEGNYLPDLSFGTHFFQDLVEASIRYIPLYPDDTGVVFNETFFKSSENMLPELLPEFGSMSDTIRVIDVPKNTDGMVLRILMNADLDKAMAFLTSGK